MVSGPIFNPRELDAPIATHEWRTVDQGRISPTATPLLTDAAQVQITPSGPAGLITFGGETFFRDIQVLDIDGVVLLSVDLDTPDLGALPTTMQAIDGAWTIKNDGGTRVLACTAPGGTFQHCRFTDAAWDTAWESLPGGYVIKATIKRPTQNAPSGLIVHIDATENEFIYAYFDEGFAGGQALFRATINRNAANFTLRTNDLEFAMVFGTYWDMAVRVTSTKTDLYFSPADTPWANMRGLIDYLYGSTAVVVHEKGPGMIRNLWYALSRVTTASWPTISVFIDGEVVPTVNAIPIYHFFGARDGIAPVAGEGHSWWESGDNSSIDMDLDIPFNTEIKIVLNGTDAGKFCHIFFSASIQYGRVPAETRFNRFRAEYVTSTVVANRAHASLASVAGLSPGLIERILFDGRNGTGIGWAEGDMRILADDVMVTKSSSTEDWGHRGFFWGGVGDYQTLITGKKAATHFVGNDVTTLRRFDEKDYILFEQSWEILWQNGEEKANPGANTTVILLIFYYTMK